MEAGNQQLLAKAVGVCQQAVCQWESNGYVPIRRISAVLRSFPDVVTADDLIADYMAATSKNTSSNHKKTKIEVLLLSATSINQINSAL